MWAPHWYDEVHKTTGFNSIATPTHSIEGADSKSMPVADKPYPTLTSEQLKVYRETLPFFNFLHQFAIGIDSLNPGKELTQRKAGIEDSKEEDNCDEKT